MRAMVLAAGRGERMGALTEHQPKPLLRVAGRSLIEHTIVRLAHAGIHELVVNHAYRGDQIVEHLGDGARLGVHIEYSPEPDGALETGGGLLQALPLLGSEPFVAVNADVYAEFDFGRLPREPSGLAHLVLVPNPLHHPDGDFSLQHGHAYDAGSRRLTFAGIGVYRPGLWHGRQPGRFGLARLLRKYMPAHRVSAERFDGLWVDVGTPERLYALEQRLG